MENQFVRHEPCFERILFILTLDRKKMKERILIGEEQQIRFRLDGSNYAYDVIYIGFPIWWYVAPTIVNTFLESYDMSGKTIIPFATSGGSGMGNTNAELALSCAGATLKNGKRFAANTTENQLADWSKTVE